MTLKTMSRQLVKNWLIATYLCFVSRTLLALGCHVGISDEHAEEKVKKMKLPKK